MSTIWPYLFGLSGIPARWRRRAPVSSLGDTTCDRLVDEVDLEILDALIEARAAE